MTAFVGDARKFDKHEPRDCSWVAGKIQDASLSGSDTTSLPRRDVTRRARLRCVTSLLERDRSFFLGRTRASVISRGVTTSLFTRDANIRSRAFTARSSLRALSRGVTSSCFELIASDGDAVDSSEAYESDSPPDDTYSGRSEFTFVAAQKGKGTLLEGRCASSCAE